MAKKVPVTKKRTTKSIKTESPMRHTPDYERLTALHAIRHIRALEREEEQELAELEDRIKGRLNHEKNPVIMNWVTTIVLKAMTISGDGFNSTGLPPVTPPAIVNPVPGFSFIQTSTGTKADGTPITDTSEFRQVAPDAETAKAQLVQQLATISAAVSASTLSA